MRFLQDIQSSPEREGGDWKEGRDQGIEQESCTTQTYDIDIEKAS